MADQSVDSFDEELPNGPDYLPFARLVVLRLNKERIPSQHVHTEPVKQALESHKVLGQNKVFYPKRLEAALKDDLINQKPAGLELEPDRTASKAEIDDLVFFLSATYTPDWTVEARIPPAKPRSRSRLAKNVSVLTTNRKAQIILVVIGLTLLLFVAFRTMPRELVLGLLLLLAAVAAFYTRPRVLKRNVPAQDRCWYYFNTRNTERGLLAVCLLLLVLLLWPLLLPRIKNSPLFVRANPPATIVPTTPPAPVTVVTPAQQVNVDAEAQRLLKQHETDIKNLQADGTEFKNRIENLKDRLNKDESRIETTEIATVNHEERLANLEKTKPKITTRRRSIIIPQPDNGKFPEPRRTPWPPKIQ